MKKGCLGCLGFIVIIFIVGFIITAVFSPKNSPSSSPSEQTTVSSDVNMDNDTKKMLDEANKSLEKVEPQRQEMEKQVLTTLKDYNVTSPKSVTVSDANKPTFSIMVDAKTDATDKNSAKVVGVKMIKTLLNANLPYDVDQYHMMIMDKNGSPLGMISYIPDNGKYSIMNGGKSEIFEP